MSDILERIARECGVPDIVEILADRLSPTDLQSLLLEVSARRASRAKLSAVLDAYEQNRFVRPSDVSADGLQAFDVLARSLVPSGFDGLELAPVCPLGTNSAMAPVDPRWAVATVRNTEVVSDCTNALALETTLRRRRILQSEPRSDTPVRLWSSHRLLRGQAFRDPAHRSHFRLFALVTAGRSAGDYAFEIEQAREHVEFHLRLMAGATGLGLAFEKTRVLFTDLTAGRLAARATEELTDPLAASHPDVELDWDPERESGRGYYSGLCFRIEAATPAGRTLAPVDGGLTDWTQQLLGDRKERLLTSAIGTELVCGSYAVDSAGPAPGPRPRDG